MSSLFNTIVSAQQKQSLITGYILCSYTAQMIPSELIQLCLKFLDEGIKWNIIGSELQQFLSAKNGEAIIGPSFTIHNVKFNLFLTPNGIDASEQGYVQFLTAPIFTSSNIHSVTIWYSLCCTQTNSEWNNSTIFYSNDSDCASWPARTLSLQQIVSHLVDRHTNKLQFACYIDILNIEYKDRTPSYYGSNAIFMNKYAKYQCNVYDKLLTQFRYCVAGKYFFKHINVNWMLEIAPNGQTDDDEGNVNVLLSLLRLPNKVNAVMVHMILRCDYNDIKWDFKLKFDYECNQSYGWPEYTLLSSYLLSTTSITFTVEMTVLEVFDKMDDKIAHSQWNEYGIIDNTKEREKQFDLEFKQRHKAKLELQQRMIYMKTCTNDMLHAVNINVNDEDEIMKNRNTSFKPQLNQTRLFVELLAAASHALNY